MKYKYPNKEERKKLQNQIIKEYEDELILSGGKKKQEILEKLAEKYGYSGGGQSIRNMLNNRKIEALKKNKKNI